MGCGGSAVGLPELVVVQAVAWGLLAAFALGLPAAGTLLELVQWGLVWICSGAA